MEMSFSSWNTHDWISRRLKLFPGDRLIQAGCRECGREFVDECASGERYAVYVSIFKVHRLSDEVTARWLSEKCPAERPMADDADRQTRILLNMVGNAVPASATTTANALKAVGSGELRNGKSAQYPRGQAAKTHEIPVREADACRG